MITDIINRVEELKRHTKSTIDGLEKRKIPIKYDLQLEERFEYNIHGKEFPQWREDVLLFLSHNLPLKNSSMKKNHEYIKPLKELIDNNEIDPFMLFINGKFVKWSDIQIINDCKYTYIMISNVAEYDRLNHTVSSILLPDFIVYEESCMELLNDTLAYFMFDNRGFMITTFVAGYTTVIRYKKRDIYFENMKLIEGKRQVVSKLNKSYVLDENNIITFRDGKYIDTLPIEIHGINTFSVSRNQFNKHDVLCKIFYYMSNDYRLDNLLESPNIDFVSNNINNDTEDMYINSLKGDFDFEYSKDLSYSENISNSLDYVMKYNTMFMDKVYMDNSPIVVKSYTGEQLISLAKSGYVSMSRRVNGDSSSRVMIFVDGILYAYQNHVEYNYNSFKFPIINILDHYNIEIVYFLDIDNRDYEIRFDSVGDDLKSLDPSINMNNAKLFTRDPKQKDFPIEVDDKTEFEIGLHWENTDVPYQYKIYPTSSYYYDRLLYLVFKNQFRYFYKKYIKDDITIELPDDFKYCNDEDHFMVFINGKKLNKCHYRITTVKTTRPFTRPIIYTNIPIKINDRVDVFYLPIPITEEYNRNVITDTGNLAVMKTNLSYSLRKELYFIFVNGKKVPMNSLQNVSTNLIKIKSNSGTKNLCIMKYIPTDATLNTIFNNITSAFEIAINKTSPDYIINNLLGDSKLVQPAIAFDDNQFDIKKTIYRALEDHYIKPYMHDGDIYVYDFEQIFEEKDKEGNILNKVNDANEENRVSR